MMNYFKGSSRGVIYVLSRHLPGWTKQKPCQTDGIAGGLAETRSEHVPNTSLERYYKTNLHSLEIIFATVGLLF
jgi:hypothetical protein